MISVSSKPDKTANTVIGEQRRKEIISLAYKLVAEKGFEGLRVREVAAAANINHATLHYYFPSKEALVQGVVRYLMEQFSTVHAPGYEQVHDFLKLFRREFADLKYRMAQTPHLFVVATELQLRALRDPSIATLLNEMYQAWHIHLMTILQMGVDQKVLRDDFNVSVTATAILTLIKGLSYETAGSLEEVDELAKQFENWLVNKSTTSNAD